MIDSVDSINFATPATTLVFAGEQLHWTSGSDLHLTAGQTYSSVAANAAILFTREGGIKAIAGNGDVSLQANTGELEILADKEVVVLSVNDGIEIKASKGPDGLASEVQHTMDNYSDLLMGSCWPQCQP